jgi:hypothetical protein
MLNGNASSDISANGSVKTNAGKVVKTEARNDAASTEQTAKQTKAAVKAKANSTKNKINSAKPSVNGSADVESSSSLKAGKQ